jgi:acetoin utilization protein AcuB
MSDAIQVHEPAQDTTRDTVGAYMSRRVLAVRSDCSLGTVMDTVLASGHRHVVVVDPRGCFEGVLPADAITTAWMTRMGRRRQLVGDLITVAPVHLSPAASMHAAASVMLSYSVDALGVLEPDGRLVGILTWSDIVAMVAGRKRA